eukprot:9107150-Ditylum_brightwellii.AAC.1
MKSEFKKHCCPKQPHNTAKHQYHQTKGKKQAEKSAARVKHAITMEADEDDDKIAAYELDHERV